MKHKFSKLALKMIVGFVALGVLICTVSSLIGYFQYKGNIEKLYNTTAYDVAETALTYLDTAELQVYSAAASGYRNGTVTREELTEITASARYGEIAGRIDDLRAAMGANDVFLFCLDVDKLLAYNGDREAWKPVLYIFDSYTVPEYSYVLGDSSSFNPEYINELYTIATTGRRVDNYFVSQSDYGNNTCALLPVTADGEVIAIAAVEIPMVTLESSLRQYIINAVLITVGIVVAVICLYMVYLFARIIRPINTIATEAVSFTENETKISERLEKINTRDEIQALAQSMLKMQRDINDYIANLTKVTAEKERIGAELDVARQIQSSMLPCIFPAFPGRKELDIYASMDPAKEVGGDFYDFFMVDDSHLAIVMADVSGKGVPAALFMVIGKTLIKDHTQTDRDLGEVFSEVNRLLCESNSEGLFITAFEGVLDLKTGRFVFVNAGHEMPFIRKSGGGFAPYKIRPGFVLAGMEDMRYRQGELMLDEGDMIFQYTDGITEATNADNELYGMERLNAVLDRSGDKSPAEILAAVKNDIDAFVGDAPQFDDITMLCLHFKHFMKEKQK